MRNESASVTNIQLSAKIPGILHFPTLGELMKMMGSLISLLLAADAAQPRQATNGNTNSSRVVAV